MYRRAVQSRTFLLPIGLLVVLALASAYLTVSNYVAARQSRQWVLHSHEVIEASQAMFTHVLDVESGARGLFATNGDQMFLDNYDSGLREFPGSAAHLTALVQDNPEQKARVAELVRILNARIDIARDRVDMAKDGHLDEARTKNRTAGKVSMDQARTLLTQVILSENLLLQERSQKAEQDQNIGIAIALGVSALAALGLVLLIFALYRSNRVLGQEITARNEADAARREASTLYRAIFDNVADNLFVLDVSSDGVFSLADVNPAYEQSVGVPIDRMRGRDLRKIIANGDELVAQYALVVATAKPSILRQELPFKVGQRTWESTVVPVVGDDGVVTRIIGVGRDVTERDRAEAKSRAAQKMEAIGHLTGGVAHDFNNLLQVIRGNLELLTSAVKDPQAVQRLKNAMHGADRAAQLTRQLLAFARRQPLEPRVVNLGRLVGDMADLLARALGESVEVETVIAGGLWNTLADPAQVESAILNLAINARDAMGGGGKLTIELNNATLDEAYAKREGVEVEPGQYVLLAVSDTGHGMSPETLAKVFDPFFTTKPVDKGTGLGLSMVYGFVRQSNGHIQIYSEPGEGTTVRIYLPRSRRQEELIAPTTTTLATGRSEVILVVEDEDMVRSAAVGMLRDMGFTCVHASNGADALQILKSGAKIDLLFTDVIMPGEVKSRDLAIEAQKLHPNLPVLFTSGYTENAIVHHGRLDEGVHLLSKPYQREELARRVRALLDAAKPVVLIVEDEPLVRMAAVDMIEQAGFAVIEAGDAKQALDVLKGSAKVDVLFTDIGLPGMRGPDLAAEAVKLRKDLKVIFASGYGDTATQALAGSKHLSKPYDQDDLVKVLRE